MKRLCLFTGLALPITAAAAASASAQSVAIDQAGNANAAIVTQNDPDTRLLASMMGDGNDLRVRQTGAAADLTALSDGTGPKLGRASCRERVWRTCRSRWSPDH